MSLTPVRVLLVVQLAASVLVAGVAGLLMLAAPRAELASPTQLSPFPEDPPDDIEPCWEPSVTIRFASNKEHDRFGILCPRLHDPAADGMPKRLFCEPDGRDNQTVVELNEYDL